MLQLPGESLEHSSDRHPAAVFKHSEPRRAPCRHDPPLTPSRPQPKPPPHNTRQRNNDHPRAQPPRHGDITIQRHVDMPTSLADIKAHTGADNRPAACSLRSATTPRKMGEAFVATPQSHCFRLRLQQSQLPAVGGCLATASLIHSAPPLRFRLHTSGRRTAPTTYALASATIQGLYDIATYRHIDTSTQAPPHTPSAARRQTTPLRLPWRSLMQGRAVIPHQSKIFIRPTTHCFTEALMAELFGWAALLRLSSSPLCPGHLRYAPCRHRHACPYITPTCFRDM